jgi:MFS family permease
VRIKGLLVSFTVLAVAFCAGRFSLPVFYPVFADPKKFAWTHAEAAAGGSIVLLLIGLLGPLVGWLADKYSPKVVILGGCVTCAAAMALLSTTQTLVQWYLFCTLLGIGIAAVSLVPASMLIASWFTKQRGLAVGVINAGVGLGGYIFPKLSTRLIAQYGASQAFLFLSLFLAIPFVLTLVLVPKKSPAPDPTAHTRRTVADFSEIVRTPVFWIFGVSLFFAAHTLMGVQEHLVLYLRGQGVTPPNAAQALSTLAPSVSFWEEPRPTGSRRASPCCLRRYASSPEFVDCSPPIPAPPRFISSRPCSAWATEESSTPLRSLRSSTSARSAWARFWACS